MQIRGFKFLLSIDQNRVNLELPQIFLYIDSNKANLELLQIFKNKILIQIEQIWSSAISKFE